MALFTQLRKGSTEIVLLRLLCERPMYGYELAQVLERRSQGYLAAQEGLLYPALHRLERRGLLAAEWQPGEGGPRRKYYRLTSRGQSALAENLRQWQVFRERLTGLLEGASGQH